MEPADPVAARRARAARLAGTGQRLGYGLFLTATALVIAGLAAGFSPGVATAAVACLVAGSVVLAPAIILGYAVKAAERDERRQGRGA